MNQISFLKNIIFMAVVAFGIHFILDMKDEPHTGRTTESGYEPILGPRTCFWTRGPASKDP